MKKIFPFVAFTLLSHSTFSQEVPRVQNGGSIMIQNGMNLILQGAVTLENGSSLDNKGFLFLKNNSIGNLSDWTDNSTAGALSGAGVVIFNSDHPQQFTDLTNFYSVGRRNCIKTKLIMSFKKENNESNLSYNVPDLDELQ